MQLLEPHPVIMTFASAQLTAHGFFFAVGGLIATLFIILQRHKLNLSFNDALERCVMIFVGGIIGARLGYVIAYPTTWNSVWDIFAIWQGGLVSFTGILAGLGVAALYARKLDPEQKILWLRIIVHATLLGWFLGRFGNYYAAESGGVASTFWSATYGKVPIQLFESFGCLGLFLWLQFTKFKPVEQIFLGIGGYLVLRFMVDFWRDEAQLGLHVSQWVSLLGLIILAFYWRKYAPKK